MHRNLKYWGATIIFAVLFLYVLLVISDFLLQKYISLNNEREISQAEHIERRRIASEDIPQRKKAIQEGFKPLFYPEAIDNYEPLRELSILLGATPLAPQPYSNLYFCNEGYGLIKYQSDRFGFRNKDGVWDTKVDVLLVGDSFTHGACVEDGQTISDQLQRKMNVLNLGTYGNHAIHYAALEKIFIPIIKPKYAVTIFYANDNDSDYGSRIHDAYFKNNENYFSKIDGTLVLSNEIKNYYYEANVLIDNLLSGEKSPDEYIKKYSKKSWLAKAWKYFSLPTITSLIKNNLQAYGVIYRLPSSNTLAIDTLESMCKLNGCTPIIAYIPNSQFWRSDARSKNYLQSLAKYSQLKEIKFIDASQLLLDAGESAYAIKGPHLSPYGYKIFSDELLKAILNN